MVDKLVSQTIKASLAVQIITTLVTLDGIRLKLLPQDMILKDLDYRNSGSISRRFLLLLGYWCC